MLQGRAAGRLATMSRSLHRSDARVREVAVAVVGGPQATHASIVLPELTDFECARCDESDIHLDRSAFHYNPEGPSRLARPPDQPGPRTPLGIPFEGAASHNPETPCPARRADAEQDRQPES